MKSFDGRLAEALQRGIPLTERPYAAIAEALGCGERAVIDGARRLVDSGLIRSFGAFPDYSRLGYSGLLIGVEAPDSDISRLSEAVNTRREVTHNYRRANRVNIWFTALLPEDGAARFSDWVAGLGCPYVALKTVKRVKLEPGFRSGANDEVFEPASRRPCSEATPNKQGEEGRCEAIRLLAPMQSGFPIVRRPFDDFAASAGMSTGELLAKLGAMIRDGRLRRIGASLHHRNMGYSANALIAWKLRKDASSAARREEITALPWLSHYYEREAVACTLSGGWPHTSYAMIHAKEASTLAERAEKLVSVCSPESVDVMLTLEEYKKTRYLLKIPTDN